ncbi:YecA family protein [Candidatus Neptunochlamydia vexilliferae]|uniref:Antitoxin Xre/MbcA/ParS-like toxin-binding domain-containing protein n=1 Tax=Candidatus Neptunichlamydia vexilliferae TaxID=1651774 RepID=A0ABS0B2T5_9BACT|nr:SEC-C domain-containing protein [Candidatus Neptunochlamydia vexilliferae]MBF5059875.1 hypothetical protein [Candidatus Neptunochlamydia vexilliferae]
MEKVKRNAPCPCGSQKKYKHCCLSKLSSLAPIEYDVEWQRLRQLESRIAGDTLRFAEEEWGSEILDDGWAAFSLESGLQEDSLDGEHFFPEWFVFRWIPSDYSNRWAHLGQNLTMAELYLQKNPSSQRERFVSAVKRSPFSFFLIEEVIPSRRLVLKDLILDRTVTVKENLGADPKAEGKVILARPAFFGEGHSIQIGVGITFLPARYGINVFDLKEEILKREKNLNEESLMKYDNDLRRAYFAWSDSLHQLPKLCNNDGDPIKLCTLRYRLECPPRLAFDRLAPLYKLENPKKLLKRGKLDGDQELKSIDFPWIKDRSSATVLGQIKIDQDRLTIEVNSVNRSKKIRKEIAECLPEAIFERLETQSLDPEILKAKGPVKPSPEPSPEEKKAIKDYLSKHYKSWLDKPAPSLNGKTPRQASKSSKYRERLEFLIYELEQSSQKRDPHLNPDVQYLRQELGL